jgi:hypothetical protein
MLATIPHAITMKEGDARNYFPRLYKERVRVRFKSSGVEFDGNFSADEMGVD